MHRGLRAARPVYCRRGGAKSPNGQLSASRRETGRRRYSVLRTSPKRPCGSRTMGGFRRLSTKGRYRLAFCTAVGAVRRCSSNSSSSFPVLYRKGTEAQTRIEAVPDTYLVSTKQAKSGDLFARSKKSHVEKLQRSAGHLLVSAGQRTSTGRLTAVASEAKYIGLSWQPLPRITFN